MKFLELRNMFIYDCTNINLKIRARKRKPSKYNINNFSAMNFACIQLRLEVYTDIYILCDKLVYLNFFQFCSPLIFKSPLSKACLSYEKVTLVVRWVTCNKM